MIRVEPPAAGSLTALSAVELHSLYRSREVSPVDVVDSILARIDEYEPVVGAFYTVTPELARRAAQESAARFAADRPIGDLDGIPITIKDLEATAGVRTTYGQPRFVHNVPATSSAAAQRLLESGAPLLGKTVAPFHGYKDSSGNLIGPVTRNPRHLGRTPGGSSSGAGAATAAFFGPLHQGSDGAGSVRIPAALCGVVGMKPTFGRVPVWPQTNYHASTVHIGPLTRSVADAALMLETLAGPDPRDPTTALAGDARNRFMPSAGTSVGEACLGYSFDLEYGVVADEVRRAFARTIESLAAEGLRVRPHRELWPDPGNAQQIRWNSAMAALFEDYLSTSPSDFEPELAELIEHGTRLTAMNVARDYLLERGALVDSVNKIFESIDYLITPSMPLTAWSLDEDPREVDGSALPGGGSLSRAYLLFPFNLTGHPAISIPTELDADGLPIGVQVIGRLGDDAGVLRVAAVVERIVGAGARLPVGGLP